MVANPGLGVCFHWLGGTCFGQLLRSVPGGSEMVLGDVLAGRRRLQLIIAPWVMGLLLTTIWWRRCAQLR